jgi:glycosyltransferase involved in cell wall biosynthesis
MSSTPPPGRAFERAVLHLDGAYSVSSVHARGHESFFHARHRGKVFDKVYSVQPATGSMSGRIAGPLNWIEFSPCHLVLDGVKEGRVAPRWRRPFEVLSAQWRLFRAALRIARQPDVKAIFASDTFYLGLWGCALSRLVKKPLVVASYANQDELYAATGELAYPRLIPSRWLEQKIQLLVLSQADLVETPNANMREYLLRHGAREARMAMLPVFKFLPRQHQIEPSTRPEPTPDLKALGVDVSGPFLLTVARLHPVKLVEDAIRAMAIAIEARPGTVGLIAGDGPIRTEIEALVKRLGMKGRIHLPGNVHQDVLHRCYPRAVVLSPLTGMALIEAGLGGAAIVTYDRDWQAEFISDNKNGFVVPFRDVDAMAARTIRLLDDGQLRARLGEAARAAARELADPAILEQRELAEFRRLLPQLFISGNGVGESGGR